MIKKIFAFSLFDFGETILSALVYSTFFPLYISQHIDPKIYGIVYGMTFLISFLFALQLGKIADERAKRKHFFIYFVILTAIFCLSLGFTASLPIISLIIFSLMSISHQQSFVFYNSLLLNFESKGLASGFGVSLGYVGSAIALIFFAKSLNIPEVYYFVGVIFLIFSLPAVLFLDNPSVKQEFKIKEILKDKAFMLTILAILSLTEVANTLISMMSIYLKNVYGFENVEIYKVIGFSAIGGILGGVFWGKVSDLISPDRVFPAGFFLWALLLMILPFTSKNYVLIAGFFAGFSLAHLWTVSRVYIIHNFPKEQVSTRMSFLSLTERVASTIGLFLWSFLLWISNDDYKLSTFLMSFIPLFGFFIFLYSKKKYYST